MKKIKLAKEEDRDQKTLAKQYKRLEIFIIIFMVIAICLGTFYFNVICFGPECENKSPTPLIIINTGKPKSEVNNGDKLAEDIELPEWMEYILKQENVNANIERTRIAVNDGDEDINKSASISKENLKEILNELSTSEIIKKYSLGMGYTDGDILKITYVKNNNTYTLSIYNNIIEKSSDSELNNLIEKSIEKTANEELKNEEGSFYVYTFDVEINKIYDKYFN